MRYRAFISYSRKDKRFAAKIHRALERYRAPKGIDTGHENRALGRFFKDDDELAGAEGLGAALDGAIDDSENLIVIASPDSAESEWVNREVARFKRRDSDRVLAIITRGIPNSDDPASECFAPALRFQLDPEGDITDVPADPPLAPDLTKEKFRRAFTRLVAGIIGVPFDSLWRRERRRQLQRFGVACLGTFFLAIGVLVYYLTTDEYGVVHTDLGRAAVVNIHPATPTDFGVSFFASIENESFWSDDAGHEGFDNLIVIHAIDGNGQSQGRLERTYLGAWDAYEDPSRSGVFTSMSDERISEILADFGHADMDEESQDVGGGVSFDLPPDVETGETGEIVLIHEFDSLRAIQVIGNDHTPPSQVYFTADSGKNWTKSDEFFIHLDNAFLFNDGLPEGSMFIATPEEIDPYYPSHGGLYLTTDFGENWSAISDVHGNWDSLVQVAGNPYNSEFLAVVLSVPNRTDEVELAGLWLSRNGGASWEAAGFQGTENDVEEMFVTNEGDLVAIVNGSLIRYAKRRPLDRMLQRFDIVTTGASLSCEPE
jgi:hypothetical protein